MSVRDQDNSDAFDASHGHTIRATSIIGGASIVNIALGLIRMKVAAIVLGPIGIGILGVLQNLLNAAAIVGSLNLGVAGARQIVASESSGGRTAAAAARRAVFLTTSVLAVGSGLLLWFLREPLAQLLFQDSERGREVGWLAIGVAATAAAGYQTATLSAGRRIGDIARLSLLSAAAAAIVGSLSVIFWKFDGIVPFILATPIASFAFGFIFLRRFPAGSAEVRIVAIKPHVKRLVKLGTALTISIFVTLCGQLAIRALIERELGATALGHFQAAWTITSVYLVFIFQAMATDYLPRLTAAMDEPEQAHHLVAGQAEVGLLLAAPIFLIMIGAAPWVLSVLYTHEFVEATELLRYQMMGDLLRLAIWPVALVLLAGGKSRAFSIVEITGTTVVVAMAWLLLPVAGLAGPGIAYIIMNLVSGALVMLVVYRRYSIVLGKRVTKMFALLAANCATIFAVSHKFALAGAVVGLVGAGVWAFFALFHLRPVSVFRSTKLDG